MRGCRYLIIVWNSGDPKDKFSFIMNNKVLLYFIKCSCCFASFSDLWTFSRLPVNILYHKHTFIFKGNVTLKFKPPPPPPRAFFFLLLPPPPPPPHLLFLPFFDFWQLCVVTCMWQDLIFPDDVEFKQPFFFPFKSLWSSSFLFFLWYW